MSTGNPGPDATGHASRRCIPRTPSVSGVTPARTRNRTVGPSTTTSRTVSHGKNANPCAVGTHTPAPSIDNGDSRRLRCAANVTTFAPGTTNPTPTNTPTTPHGTPITPNTTPPPTTPTTATTHGTTLRRHAPRSTSATNRTPTADIDNPVPERVNIWRRTLLDQASTPPPATPQPLPQPQPRSPASATERHPHIKQPPPTAPLAHKPAPHSPPTGPTGDRDAAAHPSYL